MRKPKISIIMPVYNGAKYLAESIESITHQTFTDFELIIINDSSNDNTKEIALKYASLDKRIITIDNTQEKGLYGSLNSGIKLCKGDFIARADSDDINELNRLEIQINYLKSHSDIDIVGSGYKLFGNNNNRKIFHPSTSLKLAWRFLTNTYFCHPSVMFRSKVLETINEYPKVACEDFAFFSKIIQKHKGVNINKILINYRQHNNNYSNTQNENIKTSVKNTFKENFKFYTNSSEDEEIFYNFHANFDLKIKNIKKIFKISKKIANKIFTEYDIKNISIKKIYLYIIIFIDIKKSLILSFLRKIKNLFV